MTSSVDWKSDKEAVTITKIKRALSKFRRPFKSPREDRIFLNLLKKAPISLFFLV